MIIEVSKEYTISNFSKNRWQQAGGKLNELTISAEETCSSKMQVNQ
jgi:hypothetical protein